MSRTDQNSLPALAEPIARDFGGLDLLSAPEPAQGDAVPYGGRSLMTMDNRIITAQRVAVKRDLKAVIYELNVLCQSFGDRFLYGWDVKNRDGTKSRVEGGTIQLANSLVSVYGNCSVDCDITETETHWRFKAFFVDYEKGTSSSRLFQQRKKSSMGGRYEDDRALDMVFQSGQSKAIRNVVLNALGTLRDYAVEQSRNAAVRKFNDPENRKKAWAFIDQVLEENGIDLKQVEAQRGRRASRFLVADLARTYAEMVAINDGMADPAEVYPSIEEAEQTEVVGDEEADATKPKTETTRKPRATKPKEEKNGSRPDQGNGDVSGGRVAGGDSGDGDNRPGGGKEERKKVDQPSDESEGRDDRGDGNDHDGDSDPGDAGRDGSENGNAAGDAEPDGGNDGAGDDDGGLFTE